MIACLPIFVLVFIKFLIKKVTCNCSFFEFVIIILFGYLGAWSHC